MLADSIEDPDGLTAEALLDRYEEELAVVAESVGSERVAEEAGVDPDAVAAIETGEAADVDLRDVAAILALREGAPDAETILVEVRDNLLLGMSSAMLTVDRIAADVEGDLDPKEVQAKVEGRHPMTLSEYARIHHYVASAK